MENKKLDLDAIIDNAQPYKTNLQLDDDGPIVTEEQAQRWLMDVLLDAYDFQLIAPGGNCDLVKDVRERIKKLMTVLDKHKNELK